MNHLPRITHFWQLVSLFTVLLAVPVSLALVQQGVNLRLRASGQRDDIEIKVDDYRHKLQDVNGDGVSNFQDYALTYPQDET